MVKVGRALWSHRAELVAQDHVQTTFQDLQAETLHHLTGQPVTFTVKYYLLMCQGSSCVSVCACGIRFCPWAPLKRAQIHPLCMPHQVFLYINELPFEQCSSRLSSTSTPGLSTQKRCSSPFVILTKALLCTPQYVCVSLALGTALWSLHAALRGAIPSCHHGQCSPGALMFHSGSLFDKLLLGWVAPSTSWGLRLFFPRGSNLHFWWILPRNVRVCARQEYTSSSLRSGSQGGSPYKGDNN